MDVVGDETRLSEAGASAVTFPTRWRDFGPLRAKLKTTLEQKAVVEATGKK